MLLLTCLCTYVGKTVRSLENACHTWAPYICVITTRRYTNPRLPLPFTFTCSTYRFCLRWSRWRIDPDIRECVAVWFQRSRLCWTDRNTFDRRPCASDDPSCSPQNTNNAVKIVGDIRWIFINNTTQRDLYRLGLVRKILFVSNSNYILAQGHQPKRSGYGISRRVSTLADFMSYDANTPRIHQSLIP